ncbi:MAG: hypothetical protein KJZ69_18705 [Phycisphaerales bacterium]|nr:hypothetical protein [Phycisphaerales bacterium]
MRLETCLISSVVLIAGSNASVRGQQEYEYSIFSLPTLGGPFSYGYGVNQGGNVVGAAFLPGNVFHAALWVDGEPVDLGTLGGTDSQAFDANSTGWVTGWSKLPGGGPFDRRGFIWRDGVMEDLGSLGGDRVEARRINEAGEIVGWAEYEPGVRAYRAFHWVDGQMIDLGDLEGRGSDANAINNTGLIVGQSWRDGDGWRAVMWEDGQITDLGTLRSDNSGQSTALGVNDLGHIVGSSYREGSENRSPFLWTQGRMYNLGLPAGTQGAWAAAVNNQVQVVGWGVRNNGSTTGFLWELGRGMQKLDDLMPPRTRYRTMFVNDINDAGQVTGSSYSVADPDTTRAFLMSPVYPTMAMAAPAPGRAGEVNTLTASNCSPGATVQFLYSRFGGGARIPGCDLQQNALQLDNPQIIGTAIADQSGVATITRTVPPVARGQTILFQAVVQNECAISQLVVHRFE